MRCNKQDYREANSCLWRSSRCPEHIPSHTGSFSLRIGKTTKQLPGQRTISTRTPWKSMLSVGWSGFYAHHHALRCQIIKSLSDFQTQTKPRFRSQHITPAKNYVESNSANFWLHLFSIPKVMSSGTVKLLSLNLHPPPLYLNRWNLNLVQDSPHCAQHGVNWYQWFYFRWNHPEIPPPEQNLMFAEKPCKVESVCENLGTGRKWAEIRPK